MKRGLYFVAVLLCITAMAMPPQDDKTQKKNPAAKAQPTLQIAEDTIPDSLLHPRWKIQKTAPIEVADLDSSALDLHLPENIKQEVEYNDSLGHYRIGSKIGDSYLNTPILMTPEEYNQWSERREREAFFRSKAGQGEVLVYRYAFRRGSCREDFRSWRCAYQDPRNG